MTKELYRVLYSLCEMWSQYCGDEWGHACMSAGENGQEIISSYGLFKNETFYGGEIDWDKLEKLEKQIPA